MHRGRVSEGRSAGKMSSGGSRGVPAEDPDPLEAFKKEIERRKRGRRRTNRVTLFSNRYEDEMLSI
ncbi:MAG: hypothetical protein RQ885_07930 [Desulfurococcales archaeon]|nr:hypothetical protein [Desulfurococcales archaeon]